MISTHHRDDTPAEPLAAATAAATADTTDNAPVWDPAAYKAYRPTYPEHLYSTIFNFGGGAAFCKHLAIDVGCGTGQVTAKLASHFSHVIGIDTSDSQLSVATTASNIEYRLGTCDSLENVDTATVDLITAAAALHWFPIDEFFLEAKRVLKPATGVLAAWSYNTDPVFSTPSDSSRIIDSEAMTAAYIKIKSALWPYFDQRLQMAISAGYSQFVSAAERHFSVVELQQTALVWEDRSVDSLVGWVRSWSPLVAFSKQHGEVAADALVQSYAAELREAVGGDGDGDGDDVPFVVTLSLDLLLAKNELK